MVLGKNERNIYKVVICFDEYFDKWTTHPTKTPKPTPAQC